MRIRKIMEGQIYCQECVSIISGRVPIEFAVQFPASHDKIAKGTCWGCGETVRLCEASKVVKKEKMMEKKAFMRRSPWP